MGWKAVKDVYNIKHIVHARDEFIFIGSPYVSEMWKLDSEGNIEMKLNSGCDKDLNRYQKEFEANKTKLVELINQQDVFETAIEVWSFDHKQRKPVKKFCEKKGWPNATHDSELMFDNTFFDTELEAARYEIKNLKAGMKWMQEAVDDTLAKYQERLRMLSEDQTSLSFLTQQYGDSDA